MTGLLSREEIIRRVEEDEEIFDRTTYDPNNVRPASYDIRIATDVMRLPNDDGGNAVIYKRDQHHADHIHLRPGDVIFVTSKEEFRMPSDLAANIGVRFGLAGKGLLVHTGLLVHPNFGRAADGTPLRPGKRLHFLIANLSPEHIFLPPNQKVASLQFLTVDPVVSDPPAGREDLERLYLDPHKRLGLSYLSEVNQLGAMSERIDRLNSRFEVLERSSNNLIMFGVYIVAAAFLGVVFTEVLHYLESGTNAQDLGTALDRLRLNWPKALTIIVFGLIFIFLIRWGIQAAGYVLGWLPRRVRTYWDRRREQQERRPSAKRPKHEKG